MRDVVGDLLGYLMWALIFSLYTAPFWVPVLAFIAGVYYGTRL